MGFLNINKNNLPLGEIPEPPAPSVAYRSSPEEFNKMQQQSKPAAPIPAPEDHSQEFKTIMGALDLINQNQIISHQEIKDLILEVRLLVLRHINTNYQLLEVNRMQPLRSEVLQPPLPPLKKPGKKLKMQDPEDLEDELPGYPDEFNQ